MTRAQKGQRTKLDRRIVPSPKGQRQVVMVDDDPMESVSAPAASSKPTTSLTRGTAARALRPRGSVAAMLGSTPQHSAEAAPRAKPSLETLVYQTMVLDLLRSERFVRDVPRPGQEQEAEAVSRD